VQHAVGTSTPATVTVLNGTTVRIQADNGMYYGLALAADAGTTGGHYIELLPEPVFGECDWNVVVGSGAPDCQFQLLNQMDYNYLGVCPAGTCDQIIVDIAQNVTGQPAATFTNDAGNTQTVLTVIPLAGPYAGRSVSPMSPTSPTNDSTSALPFTNGSCYAFQHSSAGRFLRFCTGCTQGSPLSTTVNDTQPEPYSTWCVEQVQGTLANNSFLLQMSAVGGYLSKFPASLGPSCYPMIIVNSTSIDSNAYWTWSSPAGGEWTSVDNVTQWSVPGTLSPAQGSSDEFIGAGNGCTWYSSITPDQITTGTDSSDPNVQFTLISVSGNVSA